MRSSFFLFIAALLAAVLIGTCGCAEVHPQPAPTDASVALGGAYQSAWGHAESTQWDIQQAMPHIADVGKPYLLAGLNECRAIFANLTTVGAKNDQLSKEIAAREGQLSQLKSDTRVMLNSDRWRWGGYVMWARRILIWWAIAVLALPIIGVLLPAPYGTIIGAIGRFINPLAWGQWYAEKKRVQEALLTPVPKV